MTILCFAVCFISPAMPAQAVGGAAETLYQWSGNYLFASSIAGAGDVNGDGIHDIVVGAPGDSPNGLQEAGSVFLYSGADGSTIRLLHGQAPLDHFGEIVAGAGDVNGDGIGDVLVGAPSLGTSGTAFVYSGADGALLFRWTGPSTNAQFGAALCSMGDLDQDGFAEILVTAPQAFFQGSNLIGSAFLYSGATGQLIRRLNGDAVGDHFGTAAANAGDVNGDGVTDILIGAALASGRTGQSYAGRAYAISGASGQRLFTWYGTGFEQSFGTSVAPAGDLNRDGFADVLIGAPFRHPLGTALMGMAFAYSGADGSLLYQFKPGEGGDAFGYAVSGGQDFDGDSLPDLAVGAKFSQGEGGVYLYSGRDGALIRRLSSSGTRFGSSVAMTTDLNHDGLAEVLVAQQNDNGVGTPGHAFVVANKPFLIADTRIVSASAGGTLHFSLDFPSTAAFYDYKTLISESGIGPTFYGVDIPLTLDNLMTRSFFGQYPVAVHANMHGSLDANSRSSASITIPAGLPLAAVGRLYFFAVIANAPGQLPEFTSVAVPVRIAP